MKYLRTYRKKGLKGAAHIVEYEPAVSYGETLFVLAENGKGEVASRHAITMRDGTLMQLGYPPFIPAYVRALADLADKDLLLLKKLQDA